MTQNLLNTNFLRDIVAREASSASEFNEIYHDLQSMNYEIEKYVLTDDGIYRLIAKLKHATLTTCLLKEKKMPIGRDRVYPPSTTYPEYCKFHRDGVCVCADQERCLYQKTDEHEEVIKQMVNAYNSYVYKDSCENSSDEYEDTEYGRIFSKQYEHLNKLPKRYNRYENRRV